MSHDTRYVMSVLSTEFRRVKVTATDENGAAIDPTGFDVDIAFVQPGAQPGVADWNAATWVTSGSTYYARILVGPSGGVTLSETDYHVYVRIQAGGEFPVALAGTLVMQ